MQQRAPDILPRAAPAAGTRPAAPALARRLFRRRRLFAGGAPARRFAAPQAVAAPLGARTTWRLLGAYPMILVVCSGAF